MNREPMILRQRLGELLQQWETEGLPGRRSLNEAALELLTWRTSRSLGGLWSAAPLMITATLDDGFGFGLEVIQRFGEAVGLEVRALGLCQPPEVIVAACREHRPALLGLTVLQFDSEEALVEVAQGLPPETRLMVGGAIFGADPDLARRTGVHFVARNAAAFLRYLLRFEPPAVSEISA